MKEKDQNFNLKTLLKQGDLDIRELVANNPSLTTGEYFGFLSEFINLAPVVADNLEQITVTGSDKNVFQSLSDIKNLLISMGHNKLVSVIRGILEAAEKGNMIFAIGGSKKIPDDLRKLCKRIAVAKSAYSEIDVQETAANDPKRNPPERSQAAAPDADKSDHSNYDASYEAHSLKNILKLLDHEEATRKLQILAVDDAPVILKAISASLSGEYKVYTLSNPAMVEKLLQQITPELFLLDYKMPEINGFELIPIIRNFDEHKDTPIIFLTSMGTNDFVSTAAMLGARDFIVKPFQATILREKIAKHIVRKKLF